MKKKKQKLPSCLDPHFVYVKSVHTDISIRFKRIIEEQRIARMAHDAAQAERDAKVTAIGKKVAHK